MKITHIGVESQFVSFAAAAFERAAPGASEYFLRQGHDGTRGFFGMHGANVHRVQSRIRALPRLIAAVRSSDLVVAHGMSVFAALAFVMGRRSVAHVWSGWGYDYYGNDESSEDGLLGALSMAVARRLRDNPVGHGPTHLWGATKAGIATRLLHRAAGRTRFFSAPIPSDLAVFQRHFPEFRGSYSQLNYGSVSHSFAGSGPTNGPNVLVGNSATYTNNHLEAFDRLKSLDLAGRRIVVPLSYGEPEYADVVMENGRNLFGNAFMPLVDFVPLDEYLAIIGSCSVVIMNHRRQQALGNICAALYSGAHVYLDDANPAGSFLRSLGATVHSTGDLADHGIPAAPLSAAEVNGNRIALESFWGDDRVDANIRALLEQASA